MMHHRRPRSIRGNKNFLCRHLTYRKCALLTFAFLVCFLLSNLPSPPKTENDTLWNRLAPQHDVEVKAHFIHRSPFREHPDVKYEAKVEAALREVERTAASGDRHKEKGPETIWQIMLGKDARVVNDRPADSVLFEQRNPGWEYRVF